MRFEIGFGLGFDKDGKAIDPVQRQEAIKLILTEASLKFGGANIVFGQGAWINAKGALVVEESATLVIQSLPDGRLYEDEQEAAKALASYVRRVLNQEAVILSKQVGTATLVGV